MKRDAIAGSIRPAITSVVCMALAFAMTIVSVTPASQARAQGVAPQAPREAVQVYLPLFFRGDLFGQTPAIWSHGAPPQPHEVSLFRQRFAVPASLANARLEIFADTRYEVYLDGQFMGRGPARFSKWTREYDVYEIPFLSAGEHVLAVMAQWSPNTRRSESTRPMVQVRLGQPNAYYSQTGSDWRALRSPAWRSDAAPVHQWGLIGATELLDLNMLPANWMQPGFDDSSWGRAVLQPVVPARHQPRSIPLLTHVPMTPTLQASGRLALNSTLIQLQPNDRGEHSLTLPVPAPNGRLVIQSLVPSGSGTAPLAHNFASASTLPSPLSLQASRVFTLQVEVNGALLPWSSTSDWHPDIRQAGASVGAGSATLIFRNIPASGWPVLISVNDGEALPGAIAQGADAGPRLLLAQPQPVAGVASAIMQAGGLEVTLSQRNAFVVLDLGRVVHGRIEADVTGPAGTVVDMGWDERLWKNTHPLPHPGSLHPEWTQADSWVLDGATRRLSTIDTRTGRYVLIAAWNNAPVRLSNLRVIEERYPVVQPASHDFGDAQLNAIWRVGRDTALINMTDAFADPWRERGQWWGDATVVNTVNTTIFSDTALIRRGLLFMAEQFRESSSPAMAPHARQAGTLIDYTMLWVLDLQDYVKQTGDAVVLAECYAEVKAFLARLEKLENFNTGLLDMPKLPWWETALIDWPATFNPGGSMSNGQSTPLNAMYYGTLAAAADLAMMHGDSAQGNAWRARADRVRAGINAHLFQPASRRYASTIIDGRVVPPTLYAQAWPLVYGVVPDDQKEAVVQALLELISRDPTQPNIQPYGMHWVLKALGETGRVNEGVQLIRQYYGFMLNQGATTWWETWSSNQQYNTSLSHGWGSAPTWFLSKYVPQK
jgi:alpha-L-rhamnosidase